ncbi:flagellar motor protein [Tolypothrix campylonemoides VB511288]|nr:flagellar motor protein [Tolypothrix campylonemoides VB511288]
MKRLRDFTNDEDDPFSPGTDLIISLLAVLLIVLVITTKAYQEAKSGYQQSITSVEFYRNKVEELTSLLKEEQAKNQNTQLNFNKKTQFPPNIVITAAEGYDFPSGSAQLTSALENYITNDLVNKIEDNVKEYDIDTVVVIGHTDGQALSSRSSNIDNILKQIPIDNLPIEKLSAGSNAELGLMRALAVVKKLQEMQRQGNRLKSLDPKRGFRAYSAAQLILKNGEFAEPNPNSDAKRRRIEIYFTKSNSGETEVLLEQFGSAIAIRQQRRYNRESI